MRKAKVNGGIVLGKGSFGTVMTLDELITLLKYEQNDEVSGYMYDQKSKEAKKYEEEHVMQLGEFIQGSKNTHVCKMFKTYDDFNEEILQNLNICKLFKTIEIVENTILDPELIWFTIKKKGHTTSFAIYRRMDGDLTDFMSIRFPFTTPNKKFVEILQYNIVLDLFCKLESFVLNLNLNQCYHNDIKPENILYKKEGGRFSFYLGDFGLLSISHLKKTDKHNSQRMGTSTHVDCMLLSNTNWAEFRNLEYANESIQINSDFQKSLGFPIAKYSRLTEPLFNDGLHNARLKKDMFALDLTILELMLHPLEQKTIYPKTLLNHAPLTNEQSIIQKLRVNLTNGHSPIARVLAKDMKNQLQSQQLLTANKQVIPPNKRGGTPKQYVVYNHRKQKSIVYTDSKQKKFIKINKVQIYLNNIRGQYV